MGLGVSVSVQGVALEPSKHSRWSSAQEARWREALLRQEAWKVRVDSHCGFGLDSARSTAVYAAALRMTWARRADQSAHLIRDGQVDRIRSWVMISPASAKLRCSSRPTCPAAPRMRMRDCVLMRKPRPRAAPRLSVLVGEDGAFGGNRPRDGQIGIVPAWCARPPGSSSP